MTFADAVRTCLSKYIDIEGRARRAEYWWFVLFGILAGVATGIVDAILFGTESQFTPLSSLFSLFIFLPSITAGIRRLHDRGMSGWWMLLMLVPVIGTIILVVLFVMRGDEGPNRFGPDPLDPFAVRKHDDLGDAADYSRSSIPRVPKE